jgi:hypothetical protein
VENLRIEYKGMLSREVLDGLSSDIAAFANAEGGEIWFGIDDAGRPTGRNLTEEERQRVAQKAAGCRPPVRIGFDEREHEGHRVTALVVRESLSVHADERNRFPVRSGGIKTYLDAIGVLLLAREKGLEFAPSQTGIGWAPIGAKAKREAVPDDLAQHFVATLSSGNPVVRSEALKNVEAALYRYQFEKESRIMESLIALGGRLSEPRDGRPLDLIRYILLQASDEDRLKWVPEAREKALALCLSTQSGFVAQQAMSLVSEFPEERDVDTILWIVNSWPRELYLQAKPLTWLAGLKGLGHLFLVQKALLDRLAEGDNQELEERIKECLEHLRRN